MNLRALLNERLTAALRAAGADGEPIVGPAARPEFGDYQANGAMAAAKRLKMQPRELAQKIIDLAELSDIVERAEVTGPGFVSLTISDRWIENAALAGAIDATGQGQRVVIDYSHPNLAKEMHVGHLRSTIIGDAVARTLEGLDYTVLRQNHVGDWGTGFGILVAHLKDVGAEASEELRDLERFYREASRRFKDEPDFADRARAVVVALQSGDEATLDLWRRYIEASMSHCQEIYDLLGVSLRPEHVHGESAYNEDLDNVVADLDQQGLLEESEGALCVFLDEFRGKDGNITPIIVKKSDGAYLYHSTDLAAVRYRVGTLRADRVLYIVDARQSFHFKQLFALSERAGFSGDASLEHHPFGVMLAPGGKPFATRQGNIMRLTELLSEAVDRAREVVASKNPGLSATERDRVAQIVGIGAVKYADLSKNRTNDYVFDWDSMLSLEGNTAPYLQYAYARIQSLFLRGAVTREERNGDVRIETPYEHDLGLALARFQETLEHVAESAMPHFLCGYLYDVASKFMRFYEHCPILENGPMRGSRLTLCEATAATLHQGLGLLGIETVDRM